MSLENDYTRRLLLLASDIVDCEKELSELRNVLVDHKGDWTEWAAKELAEFQNTLTRIKREYADVIQTLSNIKGA
jgi:hypothetical protein